MLEGTELGHQLLWPVSGAGGVLFTEASQRPRFGPDSKDVAGFVEKSRGRTCFREVQVLRRCDAVKS